MNSFKFPVRFCKTKEPGSWLEPRSQCCHGEGAFPLIKPWATVRASLCLPKLTPNFEDTGFVHSQVTKLLPAMVFFFSFWGMRTDWRALHLAVCIFFHIFHRRFKRNHVLSEREEGRQHRVVEETLLASDDGWDMRWTCMWNDFSLWSYSGLTKQLLTVCKLTGKVFKACRLAWAEGPPWEIKNTKKQLRVGGIRVWGFLLARVLEAPLTVKIPGYYRATCFANTTSRTCVKGRCFSPPLFICLLFCLLRTETQRWFIRQASAQPLCVWREMESWSLVCPYRWGLYLLRTTCQAIRLPCHFELVQSHHKGNYCAPKPILVPGCCCQEYWRIFHGARFTKWAILWKELINSLQFRWVLRPCSRCTNHTALERWSGVSEISYLLGHFSPLQGIPQQAQDLPPPISKQTACLSMSEKALNLLPSHKPREDPAAGQRLAHSPGHQWRACSSPSPSHLEPLCSVLPHHLLLQAYHWLPWGSRHAPQPQQTGLVCCHQSLVPPSLPCFRIYKSSKFCSEHMA